MSLDLTPGHGNLLGESYWELISPWLGGSSTLNTGPAPLKEEDVYSLSQILQADPPRKYYLSRTACLGILRRARERGKDLPPQLELALRAQAGLVCPDAGQTLDIQAYHINQRNEGIDLGGISGALMRTQNMQMQTFVTQPPTAFAANQRDEVRNLHDKAGAISAQPIGGPAKTQRSGLGGERDCLTPWDTQQARNFTPEGKAPTLASADGGGGRNPGGLLFTSGAACKGGGEGGQPGQGYPCILTGSLTPWDNQQRRISTPFGVAPTINSGEQKPGGLVFSAAFNAGAGPAAGTIGYQEEIAPTLKGSASGNMMPCVLCLNDQGGSVMECSENVTGTLRAQEHGHQPLVLGLYENHGIDARYTGPHPVSPTLPARAGTGGNNLPLVSAMPETLCILGNTVDCAPENGGHGLGIQEELAYTLTSEHRHAVFTKQRSDCFREGDIASTERAQQDKDATDLIYQAAHRATAEAMAHKCAAEAPMLIRRLTPLECERLQGFPDGWTNIPGASDSARYKALGNSVAIPCVEFIMRGIAMAADEGADFLPFTGKDSPLNPNEDSASSPSRDR
ncbi:DNA cytosine methyltransferase [uncultured Oscillibacter sp.]|uniref:DNA cytosine methyltransferase n=1 Tax=uncultured Oscillibacter sp. TaxID=876091 RepID=UPI00345A240D